VTLDDNDLEPARESLARAGGHDVVDQNGRRVGSVIGVVRDPETDLEQLAIRDEGTFFWRRRLVPLEAVTGLETKKRRVVLSLDRKALRHGEATPKDEEVPPWEEPSVLERIESYVERADRAAVERADRAAVDSKPPEVDEDDGRGDHDDDVPSRHLLFVSSSEGYALVEREGTPPAVGSRVEEPELGGSLLVVKVGSSPLPMDDRPCGFLERAT
jgi:hypothetical protein